MPLFGSNNWLYILLVGFVVGVLARFIKPGNQRMGCLLTSLLGIGGALASGFIGQKLGWYRPGQRAGFIAAIVGAVAILAVVSLFRGKRRR
jgi:uncharacterized membrane protein YeaQ/YmgE (transglycosylase-associated protein family)